MRYQPAESNNPSNPLFKVAALTLDKEYIKLGNEATLKIIARLNFKSSDDLRGHAKAISGESITVCFSLSIQRASFQLSFFLDDGRPAPKELLEISEVAFHVPLEVKERTVETVKRKKDVRISSNIKGTLKGKISVDQASGDAKAVVDVSHQSQSHEAAQESSKREFDASNVNVTIGADMIHWEINPISKRGGDKAFLQGEVFSEKTSKGNRRLDACVATWKRQETNNALVISGSVFTLMEDLIIRDIRLLDDLGETIPWRKVTLESSGAGLLPSLGVMRSKTKERFIRQIVRKHLVTQGMAVEGARVEISRAHV